MSDREQLIAHFIAWKESAPGRDVWIDVPRGPDQLERLQRDREAFEAGLVGGMLSIGEAPPQRKSGIVVMRQSCRCLRRPAHHERVFCTIYDDPDDPALEWLCEITGRPSIADERDENEIFIERLQAKLDRMTVGARRTRLAKLKQSLHRRGSLPLGRTIEWMALNENVSVASAIELFHERAADGTFQLTGRQKRDDGSLGPRETMPPLLPKLS